MIDTNIDCIPKASHLNVIGWQKTYGGIMFTLVPIFVNLSSQVNNISLAEG